MVELQRIEFRLKAALISKSIRFSISHVELMNDSFDDDALDGDAFDDGASMVIPSMGVCLMEFSSSIK